IGDRSSVQDNSVIHVYPGSESVIGNDVTVAHGVILHDVHIHDRCMIGIGAIILFNVVCEEDVFVSVGSLVPRGMRVPAGKIGIEAYRYLCRQYLATMKTITESL
ncbi:MAG TPA: hypothetical protein PLP16_12465, partial [Smithellaceae bacterium]|nr:hypothetical protein [Smithellaceae bacterium]